MDMGCGISVRFGHSPACSAGCWDAALRSRPGSGSPLLTQVSQTWCVVERELWNIHPVLDPGLCDCLPVSEGQSEVSEQQLHPVMALVPGVPIVLPSREGSQAV